MKLNRTKTWELVMRGKTPKNPPRTVPTRRKSELKLLGVKFHENPCNWDTHFHNMMDNIRSIQDSISSEFVSTTGILWKSSRSYFIA